MEEFLSDFSGGTHLGWEVIVLRLLGAVTFAGLIGFERETRNQAAGLRTHMLIGLAAAAYCLIMLEMMASMGGRPDGMAMDPLRLLEAVTSGVAFLAAGMIVFSQGRVRGLTTGASMWLAASLGLGAGFGFWPLAALSTLLALIIIRFIKIAEDLAKRQEEDEEAGNNL